MPVPKLPAARRAFSCSASAREATGPTRTRLSVPRSVPTGWTMDALHKLVNFQLSPVSALPHVLVLAAAALLTGLAARRAFRFQ